VQFLLENATNCWRRALELNPENKKAKQKLIDFHAGMHVDYKIEGQIINPFYTPKIVFSMSNDIYIMNVNGNDLKNLTRTSDLNESRPLLSNDQKLVVFITFELLGNDSYSYKLEVLNIGNNKRVELIIFLCVNGRLLPILREWSSDNNQILFDTWPSSDSGDTEMVFRMKTIKQFETAEICLSLPPFDKFGLIDFYKDKNIKAKTLKSQFYSLFNEAKKSIKICSPFLEWSGFTYFQDILLSKAQQNVKIKILSREINSSENNRRFEEFRKIYECFKSKNLENNLFIRNYYYETENKKLASSIHAKIIIIDNIKAYVGSGEIRKNSLEKNFELGLIVSGEKVKDLKNIFKGIFSRAEEVNFE